MKRVLIGMSGGVDSSVAAILLQNQGYEVVGLTFIFTDDFDTKDAVEVCKKLNIELHIMDYREEFKKTVIEGFINDYKIGLTPNPCVLCNRKIKFNFLYQNMEKLNCDYIATGHYAKIINGRLYKSEDLNKDQTYFLAQLPQNILNKLLLPLERVSKETVREIARTNDLINANRKDSTDVCFITNGFKDFMDNNSDNIHGVIIDVSTNKVIGQHNGLSKYTIGQRKGLNIGGLGNRTYVVGKDVKQNILYIATGDSNEFLYSTSCLVTNFNSITNNKIITAEARFRYRQPLTGVDIEYIDDKTIIVKYPQGVKSVTPGQACVLYQDNECLGGGIIKEIYKDEKKIWYL